MLNYTLAQSLKSELDDVKTNLSSSEAKLRAVNRKLADVKANLSSLEVKIHAVNRELSDVKRKLGKLSVSSSKLCFPALVVIGGGLYMKTVILSLIVKK